MSKDAIVVQVDEGLRSLVPGFMENRHKDLARLTALDAADDWSGIARIGHRMKGSGGSYGFSMLTTLGEALEDAAKRQDHQALAASVAELADLLSRLEVDFK